MCKNYTWMNVFKKSNQNKTNPHLWKVISIETSDFVWFKPNYLYQFHEYFNYLNKGIKMAVILMDFLHTGIILKQGYSGCLDSKKILSTIDAPPGCRGPRVSKHTFFLQMKLFSNCGKIAPKKHKFPKTIKIEERISKKLWFLWLFNFGAILAHQISTGMLSGSWILWHPWDSWECVNSEDTRVLRFFCDGVAAWWIFHFYENVTQCQFIIKVIKKKCFWQ